MRNIIKVLFLVLLTSLNVIAADDALAPKQLNWPFEGAFGKFDRQAAQRGFQVYQEVCSTCHALKHLYYRNLKQIGFSEAEIKELAKRFTITDGPNDDGEMFDRPAIPADKFSDPYPNEQAARVANNGAFPADLSLIVKARADGANYVYSLLTGYKQEPENFVLNPGLSYNPYFAGSQIAMPSPLVTDGQVEYMDGTNATIEQMSKDLVIFLQWASEPEMEHRKSLGLKVLIFLTFFTIIFYVAKKRVWSTLSSRS